MNRWIELMNKDSGLIEQPLHWALPLAGLKVARCVVDHAFEIQFKSANSGSAIKLETMFTLRDPRAGELRVIPDDTHTMAPALALFQRTVQAARAYKDGRLEVEFTDGARLLADPDESYESWQFIHGDQRVISMPGGELAIWL